jgi:hypothetical protein
MPDGTPCGKYARNGSLASIFSEKFVFSGAQVPSALIVRYGELILDDWGDRCFLLRKC